MKSWFYTRLLGMLAASVSVAVASAPASGDVAAAMSFSVQLPDTYVSTGRYVNITPLLKELGVQFVRVDMNWPAVETGPGVYQWDIYDRLAQDLRKNGVRPIFILNRPNNAVSSSSEPGNSFNNAPTSVADQASFGRWAAAAAVRYREYDPIWELWNEPDLDSFWPPRSAPKAYVSLALSACKAMRSEVKQAVIIGPTAARMPTIWKSRAELWDALDRQGELLQCLSGLSFHTHRFKQNPETVLRDYAAFERAYPAIWNFGKQSGTYVTEWGDSVNSAGISENDQAAWLVRMMLVNIMSGIKLTSYYCLIDTGDNPNELEDRFGLLTGTIGRRPAFKAYADLASNVRGMHVVSVANGITSAGQGTVRLVFCNANGADCILAAWRTEASSETERIDMPGWKIDAAGKDFLGNGKPSAPNSFSPAGIWMKVSRDPLASGGPKAR